MANLIEQMNILKGLTDEHLQGEAQAPSGAAPPYLVLTELNRRKDMRQRYEGEAARRKQRTTVLEDMVPARPSAVGGGAPAGGLDAFGTPGPSESGAPSPVGFASGGLVDYNDIAQRYQTKLDGLDGSKDNARAMALLAASAGILGGGHSNTLQNLGAGLNAGLTAYQSQVQLADKEETDLLHNLLDVGQAQSSLDMSKEDRQLQRDQLAQNQLQFDTRLKQDKKPADVIEWEYIKSLPPAEQEAYKAAHPAYNPNGLTNDQLLGSKLDSIYADSQKKFPPPQYYMAGDPDSEKAAAEQVRKAQADAYRRIKGAYGEIAANEWAVGMGLSMGDLVLGGVNGSVVDTKDPLGLGL